ncbi:MAG: SDR family oxidoreductase [Dinoroseobacter sp.]|nr:SDR family oxidoreductase [Dinoroseobacter sp.]
MSFKDKKVFVVGGSSGLGRAVAKAFLETSSEVWIASRSVKKLDDAVDRLGGGDRLHALTLDMTIPNHVEQLATAFPEGLDHLVISASQAAHGGFADLAVSEVEAMFASKFVGPYRVAQALLPAMRTGGSITFFSGVLSRRPARGVAGLAAVNAAVEGLTRALAVELGPEIRVNCLSPGMVSTEAYAAMPEERRAAMLAETGASLPVGRTGTPEEVADGVLMLAGNGYITGIVLDIDGGHMVRSGA